MVPHWLLPPGIHILWDSLPLRLGQARDSLLRKRCSKCDGMSLSRVGSQEEDDCGLHLAHPLFSIVLMEARCHAGSYSTNRGTPSNIPWGTEASIPTACEELTPAHNHLNKLRSGSALQLAIRGACSPVRHWEILRQRQPDLYSQKLRW